MREQPFYDINEGAWTTGGVTVLFYKRSVQDVPASDAAGRPIFKEVIYLKKEVPSDRLQRIDRPMRESDKMEHPEQWKRYEAGQSAQVEGQPLTEWPQITRSQVEELAYFNIRSVEQLARVPDGAQSGMGPLFSLRDKARFYLDTAAAGAQEAKLKAERDEFEAKNKALEERLAKLEQMQSEHTSKRAR